VILFYLLVSVMPMIRHPLWSDLLGDFTLVKYLGLACLLLAVVSLPLRARPPRFFATAQGWWFFVLAAIGMSSYLLFGVALPLEISPFMSWLSFAMLYVSTLVLIDSLKRLRWTLLFAIGSVAYGSLHCIREWQKYGGMSLGYRPGYVTGDANYFTLSALLCLPIALALLGNPRQPRWERRFCIASIAVTMIAVTLAASRGGFLGLTASAVFLVWRTKQRRRNFGIMVAVILPLMILTPSSPLQRLLSPNEGDEYSANERLLLAEAGMNMVKQYPWTGVGAGNFKVFVREFGNVNEDHIAHNTYISLLAEMGIPGFAAFMAIVVATFWSLERVRRRSATEGPLLVHETASAMQISLVAYLIAVYFVSSEAHKLYWLFIFISIVLEDLQRTYRRREPPVDTASAGAPPAATSLGRGQVAS